MRFGWPLLLALLFAMTLGWRLAYLARLAASPLADSLRGDEQSYWNWATHLLDHGFAGTNPFFQGPLYAYFLAAARALLGSTIAPVLTLQAVLGAASAVLLADAARRVSRPWFALAAGLLVAFQAMWVFFDGLVLMESLLLFLESVLIWTWCRPPGGRVTFLLTGVLLGLIAQGRATGAVLLIPAGVLAFRSVTVPRARLANLAALAVGFLLLAAASVAWNWRAAREFIPFTYNLGYNLYVGNHAGANGGYVTVTSNRATATPADGEDGGGAGDGRDHLAVAEGLTLSPARSSAHWASKAAGFVRENPGTFAALLGRKLMMMWNHRETPQLESTTLFERFAGPLGLPVAVSFAALALLGLIGAVSSSAGASAAVLRLYLLLTTAAVLPFFVTDRYRIHLVPGLVPLAAIGIAAIARATREPTARLRVGVGAAVAILLLAAPLGYHTPARHELQASRDLGIRWLSRGRPDFAAAEFERAIATEPAVRAEAGADTAIQRELALLHFNHAAALQRLGRGDEPVTWLRRAAEEDPANAIYVRTLADAYFVRGRKREGDSLLARLPALVGGASEAFISRGWQAAREARRADAEDAFRRAVLADQNQFGAWGALIRIQVEQRRLVEADSSLDRARRAGMPGSVHAAHEALVRAAAGDEKRAEAAIARIAPAALASDRQIAAIVEAARGALKAQRSR